MARITRESGNSSGSLTGEFERGMRLADFLIAQTVNSVGDMPERMGRLIESEKRVLRNPLSFWLLGSGQLRAEYYKPKKISRYI